MTWSNKIADQFELGGEVPAPAKSATATKLDKIMADGGPRFDRLTDKLSEKLIESFHESRLGQDEDYLAAAATFLVDTMVGIGEGDISTVHTLIEHAYDHSDRSGRLADFRRASRRFDQWQRQTNILGGGREVGE